MPDSGLSNTHFTHVHAGHTLRQALQRIQRESSFCQNAYLSAGVIASSFSTSAKRLLPVSIGSFSTIFSSAATCSFPLQARHFVSRTDNLSVSFFPERVTISSVFVSFVSLISFTPAPAIFSAFSISALPRHSTAIT